MTFQNRVAIAAVTAFIIFAATLAVVGCSVGLLRTMIQLRLKKFWPLRRNVDKFYGTLLDTDPGARSYALFASQYIALQADIQGIVTRNQVRALNAESTEIAQTILLLFTKVKERHKSQDTYSDGNAKLDRGKFARLFAAAASAEKAKVLTEEDRETDADPE